jgi:PEP-CTERM motif
MVIQKALCPVKMAERLFALGCPATLLAALLIFAPTTLADGTSYTGTLATPETLFEVTLDLTSISDVTLQTYGFGGGTNQAGALIGPGGTDPFVGLFAGTDLTAAFLNGTSLDLSNYTPGCPPAGTVSNFGATTCGDVTLFFSDLAAGMYTVLLSDGQYIPAAAIGAGSTLGDGFFDFTGGVFCNTVDVTTSTACPNTSGAFALDVLTTPATAPVPEPASLALLGTGFLVIAGFLKRRTQRRPRLSPAAQ